MWPFVSAPRNALESLEALTVSVYRAYAKSTGLAPTAKTTDAEIIEIQKLLITEFQKVAAQRGEKLPAKYILNAIAVKFFQVYEMAGNSFFHEHLQYELKLYLQQGLREDYKVDLGLFNM